MPFTVEEFSDFTRILQERPEWREELRRLLLTDALLSLPEQVAQLRADTERRFQALGAQVAGLAAAQQRTDRQVATLTTQVATLTTQVETLTTEIKELAAAQRRLQESVVSLVEITHRLADDVGMLKGYGLENLYRTKPYAYFGRVVRAAHVLSPDELGPLLEDAIEAGQLTGDQADDIALADVVVRGKRREDGAPVCLVVEVSWGVGPHDVDRAVRRAALLAQTGATALPVVAGKWISPEAAEQARDQQVWQLTDSRAVAPSPPAHNS